MQEKQSKKHIDIFELLQSEHSKVTTVRIVNYVGSDAARFDALLRIFFAGPYRVTQRSAWCVGCCIQNHPALATRHLRKMVEFADSANVHRAVKRNTLRLLQFVAIPKNLQGKIFDFCFRCFANKKEPIAVRVFSMTVLSNLAKKYVDLKNEIIPLIEDEMPYGSPAFRARAIRVLKELKR